MRVERIITASVLFGFTANCLAAPPVMEGRQNIKVVNFSEYVSKGGIQFPEDKERLASLGRTVTAIKTAKINNQIQVARARSTDIGKVFEFPSQQAKDAALEKSVLDLEAFQSEMQESAGRAPPLWFDIIETGDVGRLRRMVLDAEKPSPGEAVLFRIVEIFVPNALVISSEHWSTHENERAFVEIPTEKIVEDREYSFGNSIFECIGTRDTVYGKIPHLVKRDAGKLMATKVARGKD